MTKILLVTDMHGKDPAAVIEREIFEGEIEKIVSLGDLGPPEILRSLRSLELPFVCIPGNHEYHSLYGNGINLNMLVPSAENYSDLWREKAYEPERKFMSERKLIVEENQNDERIVYVHGGMVNVDKHHEKIPRYIWSMMESEDNVILMEVVEKNFQKMAEKNLGLMFRGHDHRASIRSIPKTGTQEDWTQRNHPFGKVELSKEKRHIITVGPYYSGEYAIFDTEEKSIEFKSI